MSHLRLIVGGAGEGDDADLPRLSRSDTEDVVRTYETLTLRSRRNRPRLPENAVAAVFVAAMASAEAGFGFREFQRLAQREWARAQARVTRLRPYPGRD